MNPIELAALRQEITMTISSMFQGVYLIVALMIVSYITAVATDKKELYKLVLVLAITLGFFVAQHDYRTARIAAYLRQAENSQTQSGWETWKFKLHSKNIVLPIADLGMAAVGFYVLWLSCSALWPTDPKFVTYAAVLALLGVIMVPVGIKLARW